MDLRILRWFMPRLAMHPCLVFLAQLAGCSDRDSADPKPDPRFNASTCVPGASDGELQNKANGSSVFGKVVFTEADEFDVRPGKNCGLSGARVCLLGTETCTESDAAGQFVLQGLPKNGDLAISFEKSDFAAPIRLLRIGSVPVNLYETRMLTVSYGAQLLAKVGQSVDSTKGTIIAHGVAAGEGIGSVVAPGEVSIQLQPGDYAPLYSMGAPEPGRPSLDRFDPSLSSTRFGGWALFNNVTPGEYVLRFERAGQPCSQTLPGFGLGPDEHGNVRAKVVAGFQTINVAAFCP